MGMYDSLRCGIKLPARFPDGYEFQTKSFPCPFLEHYEIRPDGTLWCEHYDIEDRSDPDAEGLSRFAGRMTRVNLRWCPEEITREIRFYGDLPDTGWIEFSAYFVNGVLRELHRIEDDAAAESAPGQPAAAPNPQTPQKPDIREMPMRVRYGERDATVTSATGQRGVLCISTDGHHFFRVYATDTSFVDYDLRHSDLEVVITDAEACFYTLADAQLLDHSPATLGLDRLPACHNAPPPSLPRD